MEASFDFSFIIVSLRQTFKALPITLLLTGLPLAAGLLLGIPFAVVRRFQVKYLACFLKYSSTVIKGIPAILLVLLVNYLVLKPIDYLAGFHQWARPLQMMNKVWIGVIALSIFAVVQITETALSALASVDEGQFEAAWSIGLTRRQALVRIVFPQAIPAMLPMLSNNVIGLLKSTSIVYLISVSDILSAAMNSAAVNFRYLEAYIAVALVYWGMCLVVERIFYWLEREYRKAAGGFV